MNKKAIFIIVGTTVVIVALAATIVFIKRSVQISKCMNIAIPLLSEGQFGYQNV